MADFFLKLLANGTNCITGKISEAGHFSGVKVKAE